MNSPDSSQRNPLLRLAVFDLDGTLIDSQGSIVAAMTAAWAAHGLGRPDPAEVRKMIGLPLIEGIARLAPDQPAERHQALRESYSAEWLRMGATGDLDDPLFPGALEALDALDAAGWLMGIATGKSRRGLDRVLDGRGWAGRFVTVQTSDIPPGKPHPAMLLRAISETGTEPAATAMIGDTTFDIEMARAAGAYAIGVAWGYHATDDLRTAGAHTVIETFAELPRTLEDLIEGGQP